MNVLLVDNDPRDGALVRESLARDERGGFAFHWEKTLAGGLERLAGEAPDVTLLDLNLPDGRGLDGVKKVFAAAPQTPLVVLAGLEDEGVALEALHQGAQEYLVKRRLNRTLLTRTLRYAVERRRMEEQYRQAQKMGAVGRLASGVVHDFNNMLTAILGFSQLLIKDKDLPERMRPDMAEILQAARRASEVARRLLALSRHALNESRVVDFNDLVMGMHKMLRQIVGVGVELAVLPGADAGRVKVDAGQIEQAVLNLAANARDAMPGGGRLIVRTDGARFDQPWADLPAGDYAVLEMSDTGTGMTPEVQAHLFEPFYTTKKRGEGTGLGLAMVYGIARQNRGAIEVDTAPGRGTTCRIYVPTTREPLAAGAGQAPSEGPKGGTETVLVVEDEPVVKAAAIWSLRDLGYTVLEASNGEEAWRLLEARRGRDIDLVLSDMVMPRAGGPELARRVRDSFPGLKMLMISGYSVDGLGEGQEGSLPFLAKPFTAEILGRKVREVLDGRA